MFAVVFIPNFSLQATLRHEPELISRPVALIDPELPKTVIVQLTSVARSFAICEGLTASQAMARCDHLIIKTRSTVQERSATEVLLQTAYSFSPNIESTAAGVCTIELRGLGLQLDKAAEIWGAKIREALLQFHLEAQIGFAPTPALAFLAANAAKPLLVLPDASEFISNLPVAALEPASESMEVLNRWGIQTVGALLALGKDNVAARLGSDVAHLFDRVSTHSVRPLNLIVPPEEFSEEIEIEKEIETAEPLLFVLQRFIDQLSRRLQVIYLVVSEFQLRLGLASGVNYERTFEIPAPTGKIETLFRILHTHLETLRTDSPIVSLRLRATPSKPESHQFGLFEATLRDPNHFAETLGRLAALCGSDRVGTPQLEATHRPDAFRIDPANFDLKASRDSTKGEQIGLCLRRFRPPVFATIEFRDNRPALVRSPAFNGAISEVRGPFLSSGNWWEDGRWAREEWDVQASDGTLYRLFRCSDGCFVEGVYD
jgi:protein ImuB